MTRKITICIIVILLLCLSSAAQKKVSYERDYRYLVERIDGIYIPKDIDEAIDSLDIILSVEEKRYVADSLSLEDFTAMAHMGIGMWMRNNWGLWGGSRLQRYFRDRQVNHPDAMSHEILKAFYKKKIKGMVYPVEEDFDLDNGENYGVEVIRMKGITKYFHKEWWRMRKGISETRRELKEEGIRKGGLVYFQYPYGCSTAEEQDIWLSADNCDALPKGIITDIDFGQQRIKVKLLSTISPHGIIIFDGDIKPDTDGDLERNFGQFAINTPNRFYMQVGDELWFDLDSHCWALDES